MKSVRFASQDLLIDDEPNEKQTLINFYNFIASSLSQPHHNSSSDITEKVKQLQTIYKQENETQLKNLKKANEELERYKQILKQKDIDQNKLQDIITHLKSEHQISTTSQNE